MWKNATARNLLNRYVNGIVCSGRTDHKTAVKWGKKWLASIRTTNGEFLHDQMSVIFADIRTRHDAAAHKG